MKSKRVSNFNWDVFLDKIIKNNIRLCVEHTLAVMSNNVYLARPPEEDIENARRHKELRDLSQIFEIDADMTLVLTKLGQEFLKYNAQEEVLNLIRLPYHSVILQYNCELSGMSISLFAHHSEAQEGIYDPDAFICFQYALSAYSKKRHMYTARFIDDFMGIYLNKYSNELIWMNNLFGMDCTHSQNRLHALLMIVGFCVALNTKQLYKQEMVFAKNSNYHHEGKEEKVKENAYKKLTLSLRGKQHLEYIQQKQSVSKNKSRQHLRRGHFKQRKTGLFWWNPHIAGKESEYTIEKSYKIKA